MDIPRGRGGVCVCVCVCVGGGNKQKTFHWGVGGVGGGCVDIFWKHTLCINRVHIYLSLAILKLFKPSMRVASLSVELLLTFHGCSFGNVTAEWLRMLSFASTIAV